MANTILKASGIFHSYGKATAKREVLKNFSLSVGEGEFVALMGPSGSGKSTFLHLAAALLVPDSGEITIGSTIVSSLNDSKATIFRRRNIGIVFQSFNLVESLNVAENIALPAKLDGRRVDRERIDELLNELGLDGMASRRVNELSGGERQRVAIARALYLNPAIILADEPTGNLDQKAASQIREMLVELNKREKCAVLLVTHDPLMASSAGRICFLKDGAIVKELEGPKGAEEISSAYLEYTR